MARPDPALSRQRVVFWLGVTMLSVITVAAVGFDREVDATLVTAAVGLLTLPALLSAERK